MKNENYNGMITVSDYISSIRYEADVNTVNDVQMLRADDWAAYLQAGQCEEYKPNNLMTVKEYIAALYAGNDLTEEEKTLAEKIEKEVTNKKDSDEKAA